MNTRRPLIAGNWKMFKTGDEARATAQSLVEQVAHIKDVDIMIAPPFTALAAAHSAVKNTNVLLGAQNLFWEAKGAFTGEIAPGMLIAAGCTHVIIGHSERRQYFGETDDTVNKKIKAALENRLIPVFCVGETESQREAEETFSVLDKQIQNGLKGFFAKDLGSLVIAYEPVWAIGTGKTATSGQAQEVHAFIRGLVAKQLDRSLSDAVRILYGGSVKPDNVVELMGMPDVDGALVGGASLDADTFAKIVCYQ
jgi:triosephosphate isomerase